MERYECFHVACRFYSAATTQRVRRVVALDHELCFEWVMLISILVTFQFLHAVQSKHVVEHCFIGDSHECSGEDMYGYYSSDCSWTSLHGFTDGP